MKRLLIILFTAFLLALAGLGSQQKTSPQGTEIPRIQAVGAIQPRISPDGNTLAFSYQRTIWVTPRSGGTMTRLTEDQGFDTEPVWSPDGKRLALVRSLGGPEGALQLIQADNGQNIPLPEPVQVRGTIIYPKLEFHPDGRRILGVFRLKGQDQGLSWYDLQTGTVKPLLTPPAWGRYALSQDGKWIAYTATMDVTGQQTGNDGPQSDIWKVPAEGGQAEKILRFPARIHDLCWTADGQGLIVVTDLGGVHYDLWRVPLVNPEAGMEKMTFGQADEDRPSVSHDGRWLIYTDNHRGATALVVRDLATKEDSTVTLDRMDYRRPTGKLRLTTRDQEGKKPITARVSLRAEKGPHYAPPGSLYRILQDYSHFYCDREAELVLPAGKYHVRAFRGPEYKVQHKEFVIQPGQTHDLAIHMVRWTHQAREGWFSGENHIHANYGYGQWYNTPRTMLEQCAGEDLNVCNFMVANSDTDGVFDRPFFRGGPDPLSTSETILYWNQEFRSTLWGHMTLVNLKQIVEPVFTGFKDTTNPWDVPTNADIADRTHWQNGLVNYTHVAQNPTDPFQNPYAGKGLPIDVALGKTDSLDINNSYAGTVPIWYRLLNCGFRLPASAGTDCFLNRIVSRLPGGDRVYVHLQGPLNYADWIKGLRAGRTFVTNGPMLDVAIDKFRPGDVIKLAAPQKFTVAAKAASAFPLTKVELIYNGQVQAEVPLSPDALSGKMHAPILLNQSGWLAFRATGPGHPDSPLPLLYAHTSPIYVEVAGQPTRNRGDALFFLNWIEQLSLALRTRDRVPNDELRRHISNQLEMARMIYGRMAKESD